MQQDKEGIVLDFTCRILMIKIYFRLVSYVKLPIPTVIVCTVPCKKTHFLPLYEVK